MRLVIAAGLALGLCGPAAAQAPQWSRFTAAREVQLRDIAANVRVVPENRTDVAVSITNSGPLPQAQLHVSGRRLIVDGRLRGQIRYCHVGETGLAVTTRRNVRVEGAETPTIVLRVPQDAVVAATGAFKLDVAPAQSLHLRIDGCGAADVERVEDDAEVAISGSPHVRVYDAGQVTLSMAGEGEATLGVIRDGLTASIAGDGNLEVRRADGDISIAVQGDGDANIHEGRADALSVAIFGDGDVTFGGVAQTMDAAIFGDGDVRVARVEGQANRRVFGSGTVTVGQ